MKAMNDLELMKREHDFLVGIDSDGCVFDTMELKHKECFIPTFIEVFELQTISKYAREVWEFVNLYSSWRGINRFKAVVKTLELLEQRREIQDMGFKIEDYSNMKKWVHENTELSNSSLKNEILKTNDSLMKKALEWSEKTNERIDSMVHGVKPFSYSTEAIVKLKEQVDVIVVSSANSEALKMEWGEHGLVVHVRVLADQKMGSKSKCLEIASAKGYLPNRMLMIGDSPGDLEAAQKSGTLFFPIIPGKEQESWKELYKEGIERFLKDQYAGEYQEELINKFNSKLSEELPWE